MSHHPQSNAAMDLAPMELTALPVEPRPEPPSLLDAVRPGLWLAVALLAVAVVYAFSLAGEFVWDDEALVSGVERTIAHGSIWRIFTQPFWSTDELDVATRSYYRPLTTFTFALDYLIHQRNSAGFRATNLLLHLCNTTLLFQLCRRTQCRSWLAALVAAAWALQPRLCESVAWVSGRTDVLCGTFVLSALLLWRPTRSGRWLSSGWLLLGLLAKETAIAGVASVVAFELTLHLARREQAPTAALTNPRLGLLLAVGPPMLATGCYVALRVAVMQGRDALADSLEWGARPFVVLEAIAAYAGMLLDPWQPRTQIGSIFESRQWVAVLGLALLVSTGVAGLRSWSKLPRQQWPWLLLGLIPLVMVSHAVPIATNVIAADRFLYIPTMAIAVAVAGSRIWSRLAATSGLLLLTVSMVPVTLRRAPEWGDPIALWMGTGLTDSSRNSLALLEIGNLEFEAGNVERALAIFSDLRQRRGRSDIAGERSATNLAITYAAMGRYRDAQRILEEVVSEHPRVPKFWYDLATTQLRNDEFPAAKRSLQQAIQLMPDFAEAVKVLEHFDEFERSYRMLSTATDDIASRAMLRTRLGLLHEAEADWLATMAIVPPVAHAIQNQALAFVAEHGTARAVELVLSTAGAWQQQHPELVEVLLRRQRAAQRLAAVSLAAYGIRP